MTENPTREELKKRIVMPAKSETKLRSSDEKYRRIFQKSTAALAFYKIISDKSNALVDLEFLEVNDAFEGMCGFKKHDIIHKTMHQVFPQWFEQIDGHTKKFNLDDDIFLPDTVFRITDAANRLHWYSASSFSPEKGYLVTQFEEITTQKKIEKALIESERRLGSLIGNLPGMAYRCLYNKDWTMLYLSDGCKRLTGYEPKKFIISQVVSYGNLIVPQDRQFVRDEIQAAINENRSFTLEYRIIDRQGNEKWVWEKGSCFQENENGKVILEGFISDISKHKQSEAKLKRSEETLQGIFDVMHSGVVLVDKDGRIMFSNKRMSELFGYPIGTFAGRKYAALTHGSESTEVQEKMFQLISGKIDLVSVERLYQRSDGSIFLGHLAGRSLNHPDGSFWALVGVITDITERKKTEAALVRSEARHRTLVNSIPDLVWLKDEAGFYLSCNKTFECFFGAKESEIIGKTDYDFVDRELADSFRDHDRKAMAAGRSTTNEEELEFSDNGYQGLFETIKTPMFDHNDNLIGVLGIARDISEHKKIEQTLKANQERYRELFDNMTSGVAVYTVEDEGRTFVIKDFNQAAEQITGVKREKVFGRDVEKVFPGLTEAGIIGGFRSVHETGRAKHLPAVFYQDEQLSIWVEHNIYKLPSGEIVSVFHDITDKKQTEEKLWIEHEKLESVINGMGDNLYIVNKKYQVEFQNDLSRESLGRLVGKTCYKHIFKRDKPCEFCLMPESLKENMIQHIETGMVDKKYYEITFSPFQEAQAEKKIAVLFRDITEKKILQAEALRAGHLASLGELAAGVAHEINNPVTGIIGVAEVLLDKFEMLGGDKKIPERIIHEGERISRIVKNLLSFARVKNDDHSPVDINKVLKLTLDLVEKQLFKDGIHLSVSLNPNIPGVNANDQEIQQVFLNIISNARYSVNEKYPDPSIDKKLEISTEIINADRTAYVRIEFYDKGLGISKAEFDLITDPFYSTKPQGEGTGLGLSISHGIIKNHGGRLLFKSTEGMYAKVYVDLPIQAGRVSDESGTATGLI